MRKHSVNLRPLYNMTNKLISVQECKEIISKAANIHADVTDIQYELNVVEDSFGYIADLGRLTICTGQVSHFGMNWRWNNLKKNFSTFQDRR